MDKKELLKRWALAYTEPSLFYVPWRENKEIVTTLELVDIIKSSIPFKAMRESHPARKVFQAIRIEVNDELNVLKASLEDAIKLLNINGRICVITFHSLEDRIVKEIFNKYTKVNQELNNLLFMEDAFFTQKFPSCGI